MSNHSGWNDTRIVSERLRNYIVPKRLSVQVSEDAINCPVPEPAPEQKDIIIDEND